MEKKFKDLSIFVWYLNATYFRDLFLFMALVKFILLTDPNTVRRVEHV